MSSIATCPECAAQFALPEFAAGDDRARCPKCLAEFQVADAYQRELPVAELLPPAEDGEAVESPAEALSELEAEASATVSEFSPAFRAAETVAFSSTTLTGWEERLKRAIESTATESDVATSREPLSSRSTILETAPEFDFHLDPPVESPAESLSAAPADLADTREWFEGEKISAVEEGPSVAAPAEHPPAPVLKTPRAKRPSLTKRAIVAFMFGLMGLLLGQYALLWLRGPSADYVRLAQLLPATVLPAPAPQNFGPRIARRDNFDVAPEPRETSPIETLTRQLAETETPPAEPAPLPEAPPLLRDDAVEPATVEVPRPRLLPATNTTFAEFSELVANAHAALPALTSGDLKSRESARAKGHAYMAFCTLAERFDFANEVGLAPDAEREVSQAQELFHTTAATVASQSDFALIVTRWWQHAERPSQGVFLVGRVEDVEIVGEHTLYHVAVALPNETTLIPVLMDEGSYQVGEEIGVVGTIVADPRKVLSDFPLDVPQLAVAQDSFALPGS